MIERNGQQLLQLVNQLLDLQKLESNSMSINLIQGDLIPYLKYLVESFHSYAITKNINLLFLTDLEGLQMDYDPEKIQNIISNLISNAIKFTPNEGIIQIELQADNARMILRIKDTGVGISEDKISRIFDRFYQIEGASTRKVGGTGIGLALTKELVHLLQGEIEVKSQLGEGTEFIIHLPITRQAALSEGLPTTPFFETAPASKPNSIGTSSQPLTEKPKLLIIEDNHDVVQYLNACLKKNYQLEVAYDGEEGIEKALNSIPDLIISDIMMPIKDGLEVCDTLKNDSRTSHIPILLLTAKVDLNARLQGIRQGADVYLAKPFVKDELLAHLNALLQQRIRLQEHYLHLYGLPNEATFPTSPIESKRENEFVLSVKKQIHANLDNAHFGVAELSQYLAT